MHIIIALFLIVTICIRLLKDKGKSALSDIWYNNRKEIYSSWRSKFVDSDLEVELTKYVSNENNTAMVWQEISKELSKNEYWSKYDTSGFSLLNDEHKEFSLNILLAQRGKVSEIAFLNGYKAKISYGSYENKKKSFEHARVIYDTIKKSNSDIKLLYNWNDGRECFVWKNSLKYFWCKSDNKEFNESLIDTN